jgi:hypothetical protein
LETLTFDHLPAGQDIALGGFYSPVFEGAAKDAASGS